MSNYHAYSIDVWLSFGNIKLPLVFRMRTSMSFSILSTHLNPKWNQRVAHRPLTGGQMEGHQMAGATPGTHSPGHRRHSRLYQRGHPHQATAAQAATTTGARGPPSLIWRARTTSPALLEGSGPTPVTCSAHRRRLSPSSKSWQRQRLTSRPAMPITCSWIGSKFAPSLWAYLKLVTPLGETFISFSYA